jgi:hypothetical protein
MIIRGLWRLAKCERAGIGEFGGTLDNFYASLAPLIAFPLVGAIASAMQGAWQLAIIGFLSRLAAVLVLPLCVYEFSRLFGREMFWLRTATVLNWSFWMLLPALLVASLVGGILAQCGLGMVRAELLTLVLVGLYLLWYRLFALSAGLGVHYGQAALIVLASSVAIACSVALPQLMGLVPAVPLPAS